jgi:hypothetical protein
MSACISSHGEFSSHTPDERHECTRCHVLNEDALRAELATIRGNRDELFNSWQSALVELAEARSALRDWQHGSRLNEASLSGQLTRARRERDEIKAAVTELAPASRAMDAAGGGWKITPVDFGLDEIRSDMEHASGYIDSPDAAYNPHAFKAMRSAEKMLAEVERLQASSVKASGHEPPATYRVGRHQAINVYRDDTYIGVMFDPADAATVVEALNGTPPAGGKWRKADVQQGAADGVAAGAEAPAEDPSPKCEACGHPWAWHDKTRCSDCDCTPEKYFAAAVAPVCRECGSGRMPDGTIRHLPGCPEVAVAMW